MHNEIITFDNKDRYMLYDSSIYSLKMRPNIPLYSFVATISGYLAYLSSITDALSIYNVYGMGSLSALSIGLILNSFNNRRKDIIRIYIDKEGVNL